MKTEEIIGSVRTTQDRDELLRALGLLRDAAYMTDGENINQILTHEMKAEMGQMVGIWLSDVGGYEAGKIVNQQIMTEHLKHLEQKLLNLPVAGINLAFYPSSSFEDWLRSWFADVLGGQALIEIGFDRSLAGGAVVSYGGKYYDWSLKKQFDQVVGNKVAEAVRRVLGGSDETV